MTGNDSVRICKVIKEFNIGMNTLLDFLKKKGFDVEANPNAKIDGIQYELVAKEFRKEQMIREQSCRVGIKLKSNATTSASLQSPNVSIPVSQTEPTKESTNPPVINDQMDWDIFSATPSNQTVYDDLPAERPEWEITLEKAVMNIPSPVDEALKTRILGLVSEWLDHKKEAPVPQHKYAPDDEVVQ